MAGITVKGAVPDDGDAVARLLPTLGDLPRGWRAAGTDVNEGAGAADTELERFLAGRVHERDIVALADSPLFLCPPAQLAYATAAVLSSDRAGAEAFQLVASQEFACAFAEGVVAGAVVAGDRAELLGSLTRPVELSQALVSVAVSGVSGAGFRTIFAAANAEGVVPVHVDLAVLRCGPRLVMAWTADAPDVFPQADRDRLVTRLAWRLARPTEEQPAPG